MSTLFRQPLLLDLKVWQELEETAEALAAQLLDAEKELLHRPELYPLLGIPKNLTDVLGEAAKHGIPPVVARNLRFDFHLSSEGWKISEVNSDVPGGYIESSIFTQLVANCFPNVKPPGNPADVWTNAVLSRVGHDGYVGLLSAPGFLEDQQVTAFLADRLQQVGVETILLHHPSQLRWVSGHAKASSKGNEVTLDAIVRFYQGEWLAQLNKDSGWRWLFARGNTPITNPVTALLTESKRFPLTWEFLSNPMAAWRTLLPESCDTRNTAWQNADDWVIKLAFSNTGDEVHIREFMTAANWNKLCRIVDRNPRDWIAQRRFNAVALDSDLGPVYPCIGIYVIDGRAAGAYVRVAARQVIDYAAMDAALLLSEMQHVQ